MASLVAKNYAEALFEIAQEEQQLDQYRQGIFAISEIFKQNESLMDIMKHPQITKKEKHDVIDQIFSSEYNQMIMNFLHLLVDRSRFSILHEIKVYYDQYYREAKGIKQAIVTSAYPLTKQQRDNLIQLLQSKTNCTIELEEHVDTSLMAGMKVQIEDTILDHSAQMVLSKMKHNMKYVR